MPSGMASDPTQSNEESRTPVFVKVGENLPRHRSSRTYYALKKWADKQFRRSLKTQERALALRRATVFREKIGDLSTLATSRLPWITITAKWLDTIRHTLKPSFHPVAAELQRQQGSVFLGTPIRNLKPTDCDAWLQDRGKPISAASVAPELGTTNLVFGFAIKRDRLLFNPASHGGRKPFEKSEIQGPGPEQFKPLIAATRALGLLTNGAGERASGAPSR